MNELTAGKGLKANNLSRKITDYEYMTQSSTKLQERIEDDNWDTMDVHKRFSTQTVSGHELEFCTIEGEMFVAKQHVEQALNYVFRRKSTNPWSLNCAINSKECNIEYSCTSYLLAETSQIYQCKLSLNSKHWHEHWMHWLNTRKR